MGFTVTIVFDNIDSLESFLIRLGEELIYSVIPGTLGEIAQTHYDFLGERMHVVTGAMKGSRDIVPVSFEEFDVGVGGGSVNYARRENERIGVKKGVGTMHNYWEPSIGLTIAKVPEIVDRHLDTLGNLGSRIP